MGVVLGLKYEKMDKKVTFEVFRDKVCNHIERTMKYGQEVSGIVKTYEDVVATYTTNERPSDLTAATALPAGASQAEINAAALLAPSAVDLAIQKEEIRLYVTKKSILASNVNTIFAKVWGQCSEGLQNMIKYSDEYEVKERAKDVVWLLQELKKVTTGIDALGNKRVTYFNALKAFVNMHQGNNESDDSVLKRAKSAVETLVLAGGRHVLCSPDIMDTVVLNNPTDQEISIEEERFRAIHLLQIADPQRYSSLNEDLQHGSYLGRDEYPETTSGAFELMVRRSGRYQALGSTRQQQSDNVVDTPLSRSERRRNVQLLQNSEQTSNTCPPTADLVPGVDGETCELECYYCHLWGHTSPNCPQIPAERRRGGGGRGNGAGRGRGGRTGTNMMQVGIGLAQSGQNNEMIPSSWILLDTCSTSNVSNNLEMVGDVRNCSADERLTVHTNGGTKIFGKIAPLKLLPLEVHFNRESMATILSLKSVADIPNVRISMDTQKERAISVFFGDKLFKFVECKDGLYYFDTKAKAQVTNYSTCFLQSVNENKQFFSNEEVKKANKARQIQQEIGWPSSSNFKSIVATNFIRNCNITVDDINRAEIIYGPATPLLFGKMTRPTPLSHRFEKVPLPLPIATHHKNLQLYVDFFFVNGYPFLTTKSGKINFITATPVTSRSITNIKNALDNVIDMYEARGFNITTLHGDNEFNVHALRQHLLPILTQIYGKNEHVHIIERSNRVVKERARCMCHSVPFKYYTKLMIQGLIASVTKWLNAFPSKNGVSLTMSPSNIIEGKPNPDFNHQRIVFGSYAIVYTGTDNTMNRRGVPSIALNESNDHGGHYFMSLYTGKRLHSYEWTELPIDDDVVTTIKILARKEKGPVVKDKYPMFEWAPGVPMIDDVRDNVDNNNDNENDEEDNLPDLVINNDDSDSDSDEDESVDEQNEEDNNDEINNNDNDNDNENGIYITDADDTHTNDNTDVTQNDTDDLMNENETATSESTTDQSMFTVENEERRNVQYDDNGIPNFHVQETDFINEVPNQNEERADNEDTPDKIKERVTNEGIQERAEEIEERTQKEARPVRNRSGVSRLQMTFDGKSYTHTKHRQFLMMKEKYDIHQDMDSYQSVAHDVMFTQMSAKKGIKLFGETAVAAMFKEFHQMDRGPMPGKPVFGPQDSTLMTPLQKKMTLEAVNLIKEKRCGAIKGRSCADGSKQRKYLKPEESTYSPTCSTEALITTLVVDATEKRDVAICDIPGAYLQTELPPEKEIHMRLRGQFVDIMCEVNPVYKKFVTYEHGKKVLYVRVLRAIYGCIESALLWYNLYSKTLENLGFVINPYDRCVANKIINGSQCTIVWYVDDNKISHVDKDVVTDILEKLKGHFGNITISRGKKHNFLGTDIEIREDGMIEMTMIPHIQDAIDSFGSLCGYKVTSPAAAHLWDVNEDCEVLDEEKAIIFHSVTAKLLFVSKRTRPDIEPAVAFCTTRVQKPNKDDWKKLKRCITYLDQTKNDPRIIGCSNLEELFTWVDASFAVHPNMRSHTGGVMSMGRGMIHCRSSKQKLNTKSSTEAELVGTSEYVPFNIWILMFMKKQGYDIKKNILFQDNKSTIRMLKNGRASCTGNSRHIDIKHFFVKDRVDKNEIEVLYCPTHLMIADYFTKPLQGKVFKMFRDLIMGYVHINDLLKEIENTIKERVDKHEIIEKSRKVIEKSSPLSKQVSWADVVKSSSATGLKATR
jgi:hypothetical protein